MKAPAEATGGPKHHHVSGAVSTLERCAKCRTFDAFGFFFLARCSKEKFPHSWQNGQTIWCRSELVARMSRPFAEIPPAFHNFSKVRPTLAIPAAAMFNTA